jgi:hypothetical protein
MPPDEDIFLMREKEKAERRARNAAARDLPVAEKTTFASLMVASVPPTVKQALLQTQCSHDAAACTRGSAAAAAVGGCPTRRRQHRERMVDFIAKKREMFLLQMSLDVKRTEIRKLEERVLQRCGNSHFGPFH